MRQLGPDAFLERLHHQPAEMGQIGQPWGGRMGKKDQGVEADAGGLGRKAVQDTPLQNPLVALAVLPLGQDVHGAKGGFIFAAETVKDVPADWK